MPADPGVPTGVSDACVRAAGSGPGSGQTTPGRVREDGRKIHPVFLFEVKSPGESRAPFDYYKVAATTPAEEAFRPVSEGGCSLVRS